MNRIPATHGLLAAILAGCLPEYEQIQGEHLLYEYPQGSRVCAGTVPYLDGLVPFIAQRLALTAPERIRFTWTPDGGSVAVGSHASSVEPTNEHELTHAVTGGMPVRFFTEGIAVVMDSRRDTLAPRYPDSEEDLRKPIWDPRATMTALDDADVNYVTAAAFVAFLLVRRGPGPFHEFYRGLGGPVTMSWIGDRFRRAYGTELADEIEAFLAGIPACDADAYPLPEPECTGTRLAWSSDYLLEHPVSLACDAPGVVGALEPDKAWPSFYPATLIVEEPGLYTIGVDSADVSLRFGPCFGCPWDPKDVLLRPGDIQRTLQLDPGIYYLRLGSSSDEAHDVTVSLQRF